ncbi:putative zinc finger binding to DNA consensus sequence [AT]GATA[AG] [Lyophyllum shimeji]|uniref:Zinc finger binding to DNA consensus sequence [AT]GATA[AG] n=1 Tax=Lyophyllum shimeji TaxID=47721 RepID=A0A9P3PRJ7_LYOSH|nr:putative zinc finger binding to DNA consensus sequence [AT]GATA[AG] [Lyophyllum shimeji]
MASSTHHYPPQNRYPSHTVQQNQRVDDLRLPSIKDLNFRYDTRRQDGSPQNPNSSIAPVETVNSQENAVRWSRSNIPPQSPTPIATHHHHHAQHHQQQQHTPPLSAGHEAPQPKTQYASKPDHGGFLTPGVPLSAQSTPVAGSVNTGPGTRGDEVPQSKRRRSSGNMSAPRDARSPHAAYASHYAPYPPQPPQPSYPQMQAPLSQPVHTTQPPLEHVQPQQVAAPPHPGYAGYPPQQFMHPRVHAQQQQSTNPYPSPAPVAPPQGSWEQPPHPPPPHHQHQPPTQHQHQPHHPHAPAPQHPQHPPHPSHVMTQQHQQPPPPPPHHHMHVQHQQPHPAPQSIPLSVAHPSQHPHTQPQQQPSPAQMQHPQMPYARTTAIVPINTRGPYAVDDRMPSARDSTMTEIIKHCSALYDFASRYAQMQQSVPEVCPSSQELAEMSHRAVEVVRLLEEYRRLNLPESERAKLDSATVITPPDDHRPPKRPWEDMAQGENAPAAESASFAEQQYPTPVDKAQSTAEQDMEIIRTKRATSTAGGAGSAGQPKSKYRKRSRATPPGKCHSCNIRETPEWRRGPDGARTLCNACGLHYAKLQRKREKQAGPNGEAPRIDMETLRASARAADVGEKSSRSKHSARSQPSNDPTSPNDTGKSLPQQHHQGSFQLVPMMPPETSSAPTDSGRVSSQQPPPQPHQGMQPSMSVPAPPWATSVPSSAPAARSYAPDQLQHQSFMRTSHQTTNHTSPR